MKTNNQSVKLLLLIIFGFTIAFTACKKDKVENPPSNTALLTSSNWKMTALTVSPGFPIYDNDGNIIGTTTDLFAQNESCTNDDTFKFNTDKTILFDEGASKCNAGDPQTTSGTWAFKTNETILSMTNDGNLQDFTIVELKDNSLKLKYSQDIGPATYTLALTFTH